MSANPNTALEMVDRLEKLLSTKTVIGEPLEFGGLTLIPVVDVTFGFGGGSGDSKGKNGGGDGGGGGGRISPRAVLVIKDGEVSLLPLQKGGALEKILESVPGILDKVQLKVQEKQAEKTEGADAEGDDA